MSDSKASCLCGAVKIVAADVNPKFSVCHCQSCRTWGGAPFFAVQCGTQVTFEGEENIKIYPSSAWASRGFCTECGTHLFYKVKASGEYNMPVGLFPDIKGLTMDMQYFSDARPSYYSTSSMANVSQTTELTIAFASKLDCDSVTNKNALVDSLGHFCTSCSNDVGTSTQ